MSTRLEGHTKLYGVPLLISGTVVDNLSKDEIPKLRHLDRLIFKGYKDIVDLYTFDIEINDLEADNNRDTQKS